MAGRTKLFTLAYCLSASEGLTSVLRAIVFSFLGDIPGYGMEATSVRSSWRDVVAVILGGRVGARE